MNDSVVQLQSAFILQHKAFRESSLILDVFTQDFGRVSILAKGVRKKNPEPQGYYYPFSR